MTDDFYRILSGKEVGGLFYRSDAGDRVDG